jgi:chromosome segregation ATPase
VDAEPGSGASHIARDAGVSNDDLVETLRARVDDFEEQLRALPTAADEKALRELRRTIEALSKRDPKFEERVTNRVDVVADRVETVAKTVSTTSAALAAKDGEIAQVRRELEAWSGRVDAAVSDLRRSVDPAALPEIKRSPHRAEAGAASKAGSRTSPRSSGCSRNASTRCPRPSRRPPPDWRAATET